APSILLAVDADVIGAALAARVLPRGLERGAEHLLDRRPHAGDAPLLDQEREAARALRPPRPVIAEDPHDPRPRRPRPTRLDEGVEWIGAAILARSHLAADEDVQADPPVAARGDERDVLALGADAVLQAPGDRDVELARQVRVGALSHEEAREL